MRLVIIYGITGFFLLRHSGRRRINACGIYLNHELSPCAEAMSWVYELSFRMQLTDRPRSASLYFYIILISFTGILLKRIIWVIFIKIALFILWMIFLLISQLNYSPSKTTFLMTSTCFSFFFSHGLWQNKLFFIWIKLTDNYICINIGEINIM